MSWQTFKDNILRVSNNPEGIPDIETIANLYASEYDAAVKRGYETINKTKITQGNVELMKQFFLIALQKGLSSTEPYDLIGEMGEGVKAYWAGAQLSNTPIPIIIPPGATSNISIVSNVVTNPGVWQKPSPKQISLELTPERRIEVQEELEAAERKYNNAVANNEELKASTYSDEVNKFQGILENNQELRISLPIDEEVNINLPADDGLKASVETNQTPTQQGNTSPTTNIDNTQTGGTRTGFAEEPEDEVEEVKFSEGKPFVSGFRGGGPGPGSGGFNIPYVPFPATFPANASAGQKAVAIALHDANQGVKENPRGSDTGHERIIQMQKNGAGGGTGFAWCACAVTTWWTEAGVTIANHSNKAYVPTWVKWAVANNRFVDKRNGANPGYTPKPGDAIVYGWGSLNNDHDGFDHIGMVEYVKDGIVYGIDGNYSEKVERHVATQNTIRGFILI